MQLQNEETVSAEVMLRPADGRLVDGASRITAENLEEFLPAAESATSAAAAFRSAGFVVGPLVGIGFSITGPVGIFEEFFGIGLRRSADGRVSFVGPGEATFEELPAVNIPEEIRGAVQEVVFTPPPDFGPRDFKG